MFGTWTFGRKLFVGFSIAAVTLLVVGLFSYRNTETLIETDHWVAHTQQVRHDVAELLTQLTDAETGQRGYIISGQESFLGPYRAAIGKIDRTFQGLRTLTADNAAQQHRLDELRPLIDDKLEEMQAVLELRRAQGFEIAQARVLAGLGREQMDRIRRIVGEMDSQEANLLTERRREAETSASSTKQVVLWGSVLGMLFVALVGFTISQSLTKQVVAAVSHIQSSSTELQAASTQQATASKEQSTAMSEISTTISELLATSRQIADSARRVAEIASETAAASREGDATVDRGRDSIAAMRRQVDLVVTHMLELGRKSQQIGSVLEIVAELAEQTNILAINATIEAAGAGDAGKRFSVVADEIRKLADRVAGSTKDVRGLIDEVRSAVNTTVMTTEAGSKAVDAGTRQFGEIATALKQIASQVSTTTEAAREIELSTKQQATAVEQVNVAITNVSQATKETGSSTAQTVQTAGQLASLSRDLLRLVQPRD